MIYGRCLMSQNHRSQSPLYLFAIANNTFGEAKQNVCDAEMYCFQILTDFHTLRGLKFGTALKMLYLCTRKQEVASTSEGCGSA